ncbi:hypothetical protein VP01_186g5 [Puccinia sorghi]|uniref:Uncharacterized protein n=1 Tax=Puccinia sorghi TaxID=27349 RepID=A0A0L6VDU0_9BASI|nr:hypothetical protein VP01_186g5 [Puccinia sorghi]
MDRYSYFSVEVEGNLARTEVERRLNAADVGMSLVDLLGQLQDTWLFRLHQPTALLQAQPARLLLLLQRLNSIPAFKNIALLQPPSQRSKRVFHLPHNDNQS